MAAIAGIAANDAAPAAEATVSPNQGTTEFTMQKLVDMFTKLNPCAKEFFPSHPSSYSTHHPNPTFPPSKHSSGIDLFPTYRKKMGYFNQGRTRFGGRTSRAQVEDNIRRTVYVSDIDQLVTEEQLANLFSACGQVLDCRICGDPHSVLRFAFVEFADEYGATAALSLSGMMLGFYPVRVLPSKTAILPVNPSYLPRSQDEREMCARTVYCTNIDKTASQDDVQNFFETSCGKVTRLRLLGGHVHSTRIAFVEFAAAESATAALSCSGMVLGTQPIRVSASKTPVRPRVLRSLEN
ncbi:hypothetical protein MLD38_012629 [Melastoma candidum]|uniref:Uncharacterized protein n=1 Tax=Melastoma candidum TaxID=119954 RepID=A0ACB9RFC5_9MYRT|nr:hypothetical protein MLD38_012629 [Melastoma candidum]